MTGRVCPVHGEYAADGVCRWCEPDETPAQELARINADVIGEPPGARALRDVKLLATYGRESLERIGYDWTRGPEVDTPEKLARIANVDEAPPLNAQTILDEMNRAWVRIIRARFQDDAIEATRLAFSPQECGRLLTEEHAALRWERAARRWNYKHPPKTMLDLVRGAAHLQARTMRYWLVELERTNPLLVDKPWEEPKP